MSLLWLGQASGRLYGTFEDFDLWTSRWPFWVSKWPFGGAEANFLRMNEVTFRWAMTLLRPAMDS